MRVSAAIQGGGAKWMAACSCSTDRYARKVHTRNKQMNKIMDYLLCGDCVNALAMYPLRPSPAPTHTRHTARIIYFNCAVQDSLYTIPLLVFLSVLFAQQLIQHHTASQTSRSVKQYGESRRFVIRLIVQNCVGKCRSVSTSFVFVSLCCC